MLIGSKLFLFNERSKFENLEVYATLNVFVAELNLLMYANYGAVEISSTYMELDISTLTTDAKLCSIV